MAIVSSGQVTIFDNNDARTITAYISPSVTVAQTITDTAITPDWTVSSLVLTVNINVSGVAPATVLNQLKNRMFVTDPTLASSNITSALVTKFITGVGAESTASNFVVAGATDGQQVNPTLTISANVKQGESSIPIYFKADFLDPATNQATPIVCQITLSSLKTGSDAVVIELVGDFEMESAPDKDKGRAIVGAKLTKKGIVDTTNLKYHWYFYPAGSGIPTPIHTGTTNKAWFKVSGVADLTNPPTITNGTALNTGFPAPFTQGGLSASTGTAYLSGNCLSIAEQAVTGVSTFRVEIYDETEQKVYGKDFTVADYGDQYQVSIDYTTNVFKNATGTTTLTPKVFNSKAKVKAGVPAGPMPDAELATWKFSWYIRDQNGNPAGFVSTAKLSGGTAVTGNTTTVVTVASAGTIAVGDLIKLIKVDGVTAYFAQVSAVTATTITLGALSSTNLAVLGASAAVKTTLTASELVGGKMYYAVPKQETIGLLNGKVKSIAVTDVDIDNKGLITVDADSKPV